MLFCNKVFFYFTKQATVSIQSLKVELFKLKSVTHKSCVHITTMLCKGWHLFRSQRIGRYVLIDNNETDGGVNIVTETVDFLIYLIDEYE